MDVSLSLKPATKERAAMSPEMARLILDNLSNRICRILSGVIAEVKPSESFQILVQLSFALGSPLQYDYKYSGST